jgi:putative transposase insK
MNIRYVSIFSDIPKRILRFRPSSGQAGERRGPCRNHRGTEGVQLSYTWLSQDVSGAEKAGHPPWSQDHTAYHGEIRIACGNPAAQKMGQSRAAGNQYENLLNRRFHADRPNSKWATDIFYIHTKQGVQYLSMIWELYDNSIVAYKTSTKQTINLVLDTIRLVMRKEKKRAAAELQIHSDQGFSTPGKHTLT